MDCSVVGIETWPSSSCILRRSPLLPRRWVPAEMAGHPPRSVAAAPPGALVDVGVEGVVKEVDVADAAPGAASAVSLKLASSALRVVL